MGGGGQEETYVFPSYSNTGSQPKWPGPLAGTILPSVTPWKSKGSWPGPGE